MEKVTGHKKTNETFVSGQTIDFGPEVRDRLQHSTSSCAMANLRKAARTTTQLYDEALQPVNLRGTQFTLLSNIALYEPVTINELANLLVMDRTTLTRDLKPLERRGLLAIRVGATDQRTRLVSLTTKGYNLLWEAVPLREQAQAHVEASLGQAQFGHLLHLLSEIVAVRNN